MKLLLFLLCLVIVLHAVALFRLRQQRTEAWSMYRELRSEVTGEVTVPKCSGVFINCEPGCWDHRAMVDVARDQWRTNTIANRVPPEVGP